MSNRMPKNQTPEQIARDRIDERLRAAGWQVQDKDALDFNAARGIAVREYPTDVGPADYVLFADRQAVGVVEAKPDSWCATLTTAEEQTAGYANASLKWLSNTEPLPFLYECTGQITRFTNGRDPNPRSREVFTFHRPETLRDWMRAKRSFRSGIASLPPLNTLDLRECQVNAVVNLEDSLKANKPRALVQMATGSGKTFNQSHVRGFVIPVPYLAEQAEIVRILDARLDAAKVLEDEVDANLTRAEALRQSILKKAFSGQLVPQDPNDEPATDLLRRIQVEQSSQKSKRSTRRHKAGVA